MERDGRVVGSRLIGQGFEGRATSSRVLRRPATATTQCRAPPPTSGRRTRSSSTPSRSGGEAYGRRTAAAPVDALTASGSGLDPHISPANARRRRARIARGAASISRRCSSWSRSTRTAARSASSATRRQRARAQPRARRAGVASPHGARQLRIYLGAAPGVGKTYAMLNEGRRRAERGEDVVVGFVETHGRRPTAEQVGDLEVVPRKRVDYRGSEFEEMDLDALLARRPRSRSSTSSRTPTSRDRATRSAGRTSRSCSTRAST